jgi:hypothetical protein
MFLLTLDSVMFPTTFLFLFYPVLSINSITDLGIALIVL